MLVYNREDEILIDGLTCRLRCDVSPDAEPPVRAILAIRLRSASATAAGRARVRPALKPALIRRCSAELGEQIAAGSTKYRADRRLASGETSQRRRQAQPS